LRVTGGDPLEDDDEDEAAPPEPPVEAVELAAAAAPPSPVEAEEDAAGDPPSPPPDEDDEEEEAWSPLTGCFSVKGAPKQAGRRAPSVRARIVADLFMDPPYHDLLPVSLSVGYANHPKRASATAAASMGIRKVLVRSHLVPTWKLFCMARGYHKDPADCTGARGTPVHSPLRDSDTASHNSMTWVRKSSRGVP